LQFAVPAVELPPFEIVLVACLLAKLIAGKASVAAVFAILRLVFF